MLDEWRRTKAREAQRSKDWQRLIKEEFDEEVEYQVPGEEDPLIEEFRQAERALGLDED